MADTVLIADDHPIFRRGLREALAQHERFDVVAEADNGRDALRLIRMHRPALAVIDLAMPEADGFDVLGQALRWPDAPRFTILTMYDDRAYFERAMQLGTHGYLLKENAEEELVRCLDAVSRGQRYVGAGLRWQIDSDGTIRSPHPITVLSPAERRVLKLVAEYKSSREIGELLNISRRTVENHRAHIAHKLGLHGVSALLRFAIEHAPLLQTCPPSQSDVTQGSNE